MFDKKSYDCNYVKDHYDRIVVQIQKGTREEVKKHAMKRGYKSMNDYIKYLIQADMQTEA